MEEGEGSNEFMFVMFEAGLSDLSEVQEKLSMDDIEKNVIPQVNIFSLIVTY
jgi:hypothetical protein